VNLGEQGHFEEAKQLLSDHHARVMDAPKCVSDLEGSGFDDFNPHATE
jgi:hypothetical protein